MPVVVGVEIFHNAAIERGRLNVVGRADALVLDRSLADVAQLELNLGAQVARRVVIGARTTNSLPSMITAWPLLMSLARMC
jgi:hypothetical protein